MMSASARLHNLTTDEANREWIYDTGAGTCFISEQFLTDKEKRSIYRIAPMTMRSAAGTEDTDRAVVCNVPYIGKRQCRVMKDSPPLISVREDVVDHGVIFKYTRAGGSTAQLRVGTIVYLHNSQDVPILDGHCKTESKWRTTSSETFTNVRHNAAAYV